jgi:hypothetical protein
MSKLRLLSAGLIAIAVIAAPAMAREHHVASRHIVLDRYTVGDAYAGPARGAPSCNLAPRVGAFAAAPWTNETPCEPTSGYYSGY